MTQKRKEIQEIIDLLDGKIFKKEDEHNVLMLFVIETRDKGWVLFVEGHHKKISSIYKKEYELEKMNKDKRDFYLRNLRQQQELIGRVSVKNG